jgi:hypothetical protein
MTIVSQSALESLFKRKANGKSLIHTDVCQNCGRKIQIRIDRTSGGFGLLGGVIHESEFHKLYSECLDCHISGRLKPDATEDEQLAS